MYLTFEWQSGAILTNERAVVKWKKNCKNESDLMIVLCTEILSPFRLSFLAFFVYI